MIWWFYFTCFERERREGAKERESAPEKYCLSPGVYILFMSVMNSADTDINTVMPRWYNVDKMVHRVFFAENAPLQSRMRSLPGCVAAQNHLHNHRNTK